MAEACLDCQRLQAVIINGLRDSGALCPSHRAATIPPVPYAVPYPYTDVHVIALAFVPVSRTVQ